MPKGRRGPSYRRTSTADLATLSGLQMRQGEYAVLHQCLLEVSRFHYIIIYWSLNPSLHGQNKCHAGRNQRHPETRDGPFTCGQGYSHDCNRSRPSSFRTRDYAWALVCQCCGERRFRCKQVCCRHQDPAIPTANDKRPY